MFRFTIFLIIFVVVCGLKNGEKPTTKETRDKKLYQQGEQRYGIMLRNCFF